ncbi:MAG: HD domain-containing protein, partial [Verrucomicrobiota bacterium]|nr:HD domain-containing protein [Verrucomicrobiota bacterium]
LRVLRAFQLAARFDLSLAPETAALCRTMAGTFAELPAERVWGEWEKWAAKSAAPARGLAMLEETGWLKHFPEVAALRGTLQEPEWHPEGDVFTHTQFCLDALVRLPEWQAAEAPRRRYLTFAVLAHDFGKPATTEKAERRGQLRWISPGHESAGGPLAENFLARIGAPREVAEFVRPLVIHHLAHHHGRTEFTDTSVRRLARRLEPATIDDLCLVMLADHGGRPPLKPPEILERIAELRDRAHALALADAAPRPIIMGCHLIALGHKPGPAFKNILDTCFEAQLDGAFQDEAGGLAFLKNYLHNPKSDLV